MTRDEEARLDEAREVREARTEGKLWGFSPAEIEEEVQRIRAAQERHRDVRRPKAAPAGFQQGQQGWLAPFACTNCDDGGLVLAVDHRPCGYRKTNTCNCPEVEGACPDCRCSWCGEAGATLVDETGTHYHRGECATRACSEHHQPPGA